MTKSPARLYTAVSGIFLLLQGTSTLAFRLFPPLDRAFPALLATTQMIPIHSTLHIITGLLAVVILYRGGEYEAFLFAAGFGLFYLMLGLTGVLSGHHLGLGLQPFDHPIHLVLGVVGLFAAYRSFSHKEGFSMNTQGTPIALPLRLWLAVEVLFGIGAVLAIGVSPAETKTNFAWPIQPVVMAAVLGAFYMSSALLFLLPLFAKRWEMIRVMILPTAIFSTVQLIATFLHWDKFSVGTTPFYVWFASYLLPPPIFISAYLWHQRRASQPNTNSDSPLPTWMRSLFWVSGIIVALGALSAFIFPTLLIPNFPWQLTPLTTRSLCGWIMILGVILIAMARENDRARVRLGTPFLILILPTLLLQMSRFSEQVNWADPVLWVGLAFVTLICVCGLYLATGSWRESMS